MSFRRLFEINSVLAIAIYLPLMSFIASKIAKDDHDSFEKHSTLFLWVPALAGIVGTFGLNDLAGSVSCGLSSLALTTLIGNLRLKTCLLLSSVAPLILFVTTRIGTTVQNLLNGST